MKTKANYVSRLTPEEKKSRLMRRAVHYLTHYAATPIRMGCLVDGTWTPPSAQKEHEAICKLIKELRNNAKP